MFKNLGLLFVLLFVVSCSSTKNKNQKIAELHFATGTQNLMAQEYTEALTNLLKADKMDPNNSAILTNLGMAYYFKGEKQEAIKVLERSIVIDKNNSDSKVNLASIYFREGDLKQSERMYREVLKDLTYDKQARTLYNLGIIEIEKSDSVAAENYFRKSLKEDSNYCPASFQLGLMNYNRKEYQKSHTLFKDASFGTCFNSAAAHYYQALSLIGLNKITEARIKLNEVEVRFNKSEFALRARQKMAELSKIETQSQNDTYHASGDPVNSPEF